MQGQFETVYCVHCKAPIHPQAVVCPRCHGDQRPGAPPPYQAGPAPGQYAPPGYGQPPPPFAPPGYAYPPGAYRKQRSAGVVMVAIIMGFNVLIRWLDTFVVSKTGTTPPPNLGLPTGGVDPGVFHSAYLAGSIMGLLTSSAIAAVVIVGILMLQRWARILAIVANFTGAAMVLFGLALGTLGGFMVLGLLINLTVAIWLLCLGRDFSA